MPRITSKQLFFISKMSWKAPLSNILEEKSDAWILLGNGRDRGTPSVKSGSLQRISGGGGGGSSVALSNVTATLGRAYQNEAWSRDITCRCVVYVEASRQSQASHSVTWRCIISGRGDNAMSPIQRWAKFNEQTYFR